MIKSIVQIASAIYGGYDQPKQIPDGMTFSPTLFTDSQDTAELAEERGWYPIVDELEDIATPMLRAKYWKTHLGYALPAASVAIWLDGSMQITGDGDTFTQLCVDALGDDDVSLTPHPERTCIHPEAKVTASLARYADCDPLGQVEHYRAIGHPDNWGLFASGAFTIRPSKVTDEWGNFWWDECINWTYQDQLSLPVITKIMQDGGGLTWNKNMPWHTWWTLTPHGY